MKTSLSLAFSLFLSVPLCIRAQQEAIRLEELKLPEHASVPSILCLFEDSEGFLWIGGYSGLFRYDGYTFTEFLHDPENPKSIGDNKIQNIVEDKEGYLWIGTQAGLNRFDKRRREFVRYADSTRHGLSKIFINTLTLDNEGYLWTATAHGLFRYDRKQDRFVQVNHCRQEDTHAVVEIIKPASDGIWTEISSRWIGRLQYSGACVTYPVPIRMGRSSGISTMITRFEPLENGDLWVGTTDGLYLFDHKKGAFHLVDGLDDILIVHLSVVNDRWMAATSNGLYYLDAASRTAAGPLDIILNGQIAPIKDIFSFDNVPGGITWFCAANGKTYVLDPQKNRFRHTPLDLIAGMSGIITLCELYEYQPGVLLIPRPEGPVWLELQSGRMRTFPHRPTYNREGWDKGLTCFFEQNDSLLWIGTAGGVFLFDKSRNRFLPIERGFKELELLRTVQVRDIHYDRKGRLWIAGWSEGLIKIDFSQKRVKQYLVTPEEMSTYLHGGRYIFEARNGELWFGTRGGLLKYLEQQDSFMIYSHDPENPGTMSDNTAFCIHEAPDGKLWIGTYGGGLNCLDPGTGRFRHFTTKDGLLDNNVFGILPDANNNLWLLGYKGISRYNPETEHFVGFKKEQGLLSNGYTAFVYGKSRYSNTLFFGGNNGVDYFDPKEISVSNPPPNIRFTGFSLFNKPVPVSGESTEPGQFFLTTDVGLSDAITIRYDQNVVGFEFAALEFSSPQTIRYAYQLVGFDTAWQYIGNRRNATFTNLAPGQYTMQVKTSNGDGNWDPSDHNVQSIRLTVTPPWWQTWLFRGTAALLSIGLVAAGYTYRIRQIRERAALNQRIAQVKMEALRSQMNPHFVFNCLSSLKLLVEKNETEKASEHINKFATLLRQVLDDARAETETVSLERELDTLQRYVDLEKMRFKDRFDFRLQVSPEVERTQLMIPPLILQPYVENAILHGLQPRPNGNGLLQVRVDKVNERVLIQIEDNGIGRTAAQAIRSENHGTRRSHGLNVTEERLDYFAQKFNIRTAVITEDLHSEDGTPSGTRVTLAFEP